MTPDTSQIVFEGVSKFYGEVLGVNKVSFSLHPGLTSLVGPNGSGKTTLMNLLTGLIRPSQGAIYVLGLTRNSLSNSSGRWDIARSLTPSLPVRMATTSFIGLCVSMVLATARRRSLRTKPWSAPAWRKWRGAEWRVIAKVMRQRIRLAQAIAHHPSVLVLDEPLNGLDPMARAESIALFEAIAKQGMHVIISSHILEKSIEFLTASC